MAELFAKDYTGEAFRHFALPHLVALAIIGLANLSLYFMRHRFDPPLRQRFRYGLAAVLLVNELSWHTWQIATGQWTVQTMLPLHLCSTMVFLSAAMLVSQSYTLYEALYFLGIGAALQALLTPDLGIYGFPHYRFFQCFISHGSILTSAVYMTVVEGYRPYWSSLLRTAVVTNLYMLAVGLVNALLGSNYLFIAHKPPTASVIDLLGPWPWYILGLEAIGAVTFLILYLPFAIRDRQARS